MVNEGETSELATFECGACGQRWTHSEMVSEERLAWGAWACPGCNTIHKDDSESGPSSDDELAGDEPPEIDPDEVDAEDLDVDAILLECPQCHAAVLYQDAVISDEFDNAIRCSACGGINSADDYFV